MKLILLLVAIYSLIFYQQYKIQKSKASIPEPASKIVRMESDGAFRDLPDFKTAKMMIRSTASRAKEQPIAADWYYQ